MNMNTFDIHTLGCGSAKPSLRHNPSCTVIDHRGTLYMIDCGEGAQLEFQRHHLKFSRLRHIFITHLHGDHVLGLPGLLSTLQLSGVGGIITIHTFEEGRKILSEIIDFFARDLPFQLEFNIIRPEEKTILETPALSVRTLPLRHRIPTVGFIFEEKPNPRHIIRDMIDFHRIPYYMINAIKAGQDFVKPDGTVVPNDRLTTPADPARSYAHISDTIYMPSLAPKIGPVDILFHETTYLETNADLARQRFHSTARQAAMVARDAGARKLLTGHYSSRYDNEKDFLDEAKEVFPEVILNQEGLVTHV